MAEIFAHRRAREAFLYPPPLTYLGYVAVAFGKLQSNNVHGPSLSRANFSSCGPFERHLPLRCTSFLLKYFPNSVCPCFWYIPLYTRTRALLVKARLAISDDHRRRLVSSPRSLAFPNPAPLL